MRSARQKQEEALALLHAQSSIKSLQQTERIIEETKPVVRASLELSERGAVLRCTQRALQPLILHCPQLPDGGCSRKGAC